jgi:hypothetical protein
MNPSRRTLRTECGTGEGMEFRIGIGRIDSGLWEGAETATGTGVREVLGLDARLIEGADMGVTTVGTGRVAAWGAVS